MSQLSILNVGAGDTKLSFDPKNKAEREHAKRVVQDMLKRGYAIMVQIGVQDGEPIYRRAKKFDPKTCEYIVMGVPSEEETAAPASPAATPAKRGRGRQRRIKAESTNAVAVARSAGG